MIFKSKFSVIPINCSMAVVKTKIPVSLADIAIFVLGLKIVSK